MSFQITARKASDADPAPAECRDTIGSLLFYRVEWCERRPGLMLAAVGALVVLQGALEKML